MKLSIYLARRLSIDSVFLSDCVSIVQEEYSFMTTGYFAKRLAEYINVDAECIQKELIEYCRVSLVRAWVSSIV